MLTDQVTDYSRSIAVFTYYCGDLSYSNRATIGFTTTDGLFANHPATTRGNAKDIACLNYTQCLHGLMLCTKFHNMVRLYITINYFYSSPSQ